MASTARASRTGQSTAQRGDSPRAADEIARIAYELFERRGRMHGRDQDDWFEAERLVRARRRGNGRG